MADRRIRFETLGVQQFMFREAFPTLTDARATLRGIREAGYDSIEMCGFLMAPNAEKAEYPWPELLAEAGLTVCGLHESVEDLMANTDKLIDRAHCLGAKRMVACATTATDFSVKADVDRLIDSLNHLTPVMADAGLPLLFHNHNQELEILPGTHTTALGRMLEETQVLLELDVAHVQTAGGSPEGWCRRAVGRLGLLHVSDRAPAHDGPGRLMRPMQSLPLGEGLMEWPAILEAAANSGARGIVLECAANWRDGYPMKDAAISRGYLRALLGR